MFWINIIVLDSISRSYHLYFLKAFYCSQHLLLDLGWKAIAYTVWVEYVCVETLGLQPDLVRLFVWKTDHFFLYRWTVARALAFATVPLEFRQ